LPHLIANNGKELPVFVLRRGSRHVVLSCGVSWLVVQLKLGVASGRWSSKLMFRRHGASHANAALGELL
jgi:hypothetical protein